MSQTGVGEVYWILEFEDGHVVGEGILSASYEEIPMDSCLPYVCFGDECLRLMLIRYIVLALRVKTVREKY